MASSQGLDLLLTPETESRDGVSTELQSEERFGVLLLAVALWDVAARLVRCVLHAATSFVITRFLTEQLEGRMKESAEPGISLAARQEVCRKRCSASKAPSQSLLLTGTVPSQLTVGQPVLDKLQAFHAVYRIKEFDTIVVLDLDETLVSSYNAKGIPEHLLTGEQRHFLVHYTPSSNCSATIAVFPRPGLRAFLKQLSAFAEVILYTAGNAGYAKPVADILDPDGTFFAARLYRCSTVRTLCGQDYVKDLSRLGRSLGRTVLVDNDPYSGLLQPCNLLPTNAYYGESSDRLLLETLLPYLKRLAEQPDVRKPLTEDFKMAEYFRRQGYLLYEDPSSGFLTAAASVIS